MERIEIKSAQDGIVAQLSRAILDGDIPTGTELTQVGLANDLGVSRMPVREALFALEHQGLVTRLPNNHCRVVRPTATQLARVLAMCEAMELSVLRSLAPEQAAALPAEERGFHLALREACGEGYPRRVLTTTVDVYVRYIIKCDAVSCEPGASGREELLRSMCELAAKVAQAGTSEEAPLGSADEDAPEEPVHVRAAGALGASGSAEDLRDDVSERESPSAPDAAAALTSTLSEYFKLLESASPFVDEEA